MEEIERVADVTAEYPIRQVWKLLRAFLDISSVSDTIRRVQNVPEGKQEANIKKQAQQVGYCVRQAEEYFRASSQVDLATRPTLLYYGAVSLSRALVLLRKDGSHSFDALRKARRHNHHGLDLDGGLAGQARAGDGPAAFFDSIRCRVHIENGEPWGHFPLFYRSLVRASFGLDFESHDVGKALYLSGSYAHACADILPLESIVQRELNFLSLMKSLPDIYHDLRGVGVEPLLCDGNVKVTTRRTYRVGEKGEKELDKTETTHEFFLDNLTSESKAAVLAAWQERNPMIKLTDDLGSHVHLELKFSFAADENPPGGYYPDLVDDVVGHKFYILAPDDYVPEPAAHLIALFCLGMLARYYPDIWIRAIDESVQISELIDSVLNVIHRKFPNLILDQMTLTKHHIHQ